jgi:hypothetical protein
VRQRHASCDNGTKPAKTRTRDRDSETPTQPLDWPTPAGIFGNRRRGVDKVSRHHGLN